MKMVFIYIRGSVHIKENVEVHVHVVKLNFDI